MRKIHAIIPAGGAGTRLWPLSRRSQPKFLLDLMGEGRSLLQQTVDRLLPVSESVTVVTGAVHQQAVEDQLAGMGVTVLAEPSARDSMAAIGYGAYVVGEKYGPEAVVGSFAADHAIANQSAFEAAVNAAVRGGEAGYLTTIGIEPAEPSSAYGYIEPSALSIATDVYKVARFVEKPTPEVADRYVQEGYLWNAGIFIAEVGTIARALQEFLPQMDETLRVLAQKGMRSELWDSLQRIAIDYALAEPMAARGQVAITPAPVTMGWSDVGDFAALASLGAGGQPEVSIDSSGAVYLASAEVRGRVVATVGIPEAVIVETPDALLVTDLEHAQSVKKVTTWLNEHGRSELL